MKSKKTFASQLTNRYLVIVRNEEDFAEKTTLTFTYAKLTMFIVSICMIIFIISLFLVNTLLKQWFDPRYAQAESNRKLIELSLAVDSLEHVIVQSHQFFNSFQYIVSGDSTLETENAYLASVDDRSVDGKIMRSQTEGDLQPSKIDTEFREEFEESGVEMLTSASLAPSSQLDELFFFSPLGGIISAPYNPKIGHYGVDVVSKKNEPIKSVADGTVIMASWTQDAGYVITLQHRSNVISVYKHNSSLLKKTGDFVSAGDVVAIIGNTGELTTGPHLHFELWYNGNPMNPEEFVSF
ncbi:MAG: M23 family metallopeptidase [Tunicatimonas sp.]|uniref:M23 family metallopeptidase n=1 Tax=Tunicatimonas sp. TaxID=1940096 RepID=UPI003C725E66